MHTWEGVRKKHPYFVALVDLLMRSKHWREDCPSVNCWHFTTKDSRYQALVIWPEHRVKLWRKEI